MGLHLLTVLQGLYSNEVSRWSVTNFVKASYFNFIRSSEVKSANYNFCAVTSNILFSIKLGSKASVSYAVSQELSIVREWRDTFPGYVNGS